MSSVTSPRGPLPTRVYWIRRAVVLVLALALVFLIGKVLTGFGGGDSSGGGNGASTVAQESPAASESAETTPPATGTLTPDVSGDAASGASSAASPNAKAEKTAGALPASTPQGTCDDEDVIATPVLDRIAGGSAVALPLKLTTTGDACTWRVSKTSLVLKITSGTDRVWTSQDCPAGVPTQDVVVRPEGEKVARVNVTWSGRRSAEDCAKGQDWASPGYYHAVAAALGGEPTDVQFQVGPAPTPTVTKTTHPKPKKHSKATKTPKG